MTELNARLIVKTRPNSCKESIIDGEGYRITVLTPCLIRVEVQKDNIFTEEATQNIWFRDFPKVPYKAGSHASTIVVETSECKFNFNTKFKKVISVYLEKEGKWVTVNDKHNLGGTLRTLDMRLGKVGVDNGVLSSDGVATIKDDSIVLGDDGTLRARKAKESDTYVFAYGKNYKGALDAYFYMTGSTPMLPKYVLGNWWSRYYAYTQEEYINLMKRFEKENVPITVATVDMDWHWVKVNKKFGTNYPKNNLVQTEGWTGYSWNTDLFPDYKEFLKWLKDHKYHVTLNLHPASGVRAFEDMYEDMAKAMGVDPATKETIPFDIADNKFINAYFDVLHHPYEDQGVDFWWIDWQQGTKSTLKDVDPLWVLNHYHYLDNTRGNKRGMVLSRYCGIGAHRYPLGFSGDYITRWKSLAFQPEFTNMASNVGYDWWSHDIGGHNFGVYDSEMYLRWCQYGVFSPINRLHSTCFALQGKEPWKHNTSVHNITNDYLRLRHALIPYIYTASYHTHKDNEALCQPMYYAYPDKKEAYTVPNQYFFGTELIVCPITKKANKRTSLAEVKVWLPEGRYTDIFTGQIYQGGRYVTMCRDLEHLPVLAKEGAILPLSDDEGNGCDNPTNIKLMVYRGNNTYSLYEDDGMTNGYENGEFATTSYTVSEDGNTVKLVINATEGDLSIVPKTRKYKILFKDLTDGEVTINGEKVEFSEVLNVEVDSSVGVEIVVTGAKALENPDFVEQVNLIYSRYQGSNLSKMLRYLPLQNIKDKDKLIKAVKRSLFPKAVKTAALEKLL